MRIQNMFFLASSKIRRIFDQNNINIPLLSRYINKDNVFFKMDFHTKEDCLDFMIKKLEKDGVVKKEGLTSNLVTLL